MSQRKRERRLARRPAFRDPKPRILVVCEGNVTEPEYFVGFRNACKNPLVEIEVEPGAGVPKSCVNRAKELKVATEISAKHERDDNLKYDSVWVVFDIDDHPHVPESRNMARENGIELAISNPSFELWLLLHFRDSPGMQHREQMTSLLKGYLPNYEKSVAFPSLSPGYNLAVVHAKRLEEAAVVANEEGRNPSTGVWRLTESIRGDAIVP